MIAFGRYEVSSIVNGALRLDGGAMFGVVPKVLWQNVTDVDSLNRIPLATRTLLAIDRAARRIVLVDTGCGTKWSPKDAERYGVQPDPMAIPRTLQAAGFVPEDVTDVIVTHLHFDHNGGLTSWYDEPGGPTTLVYPRARHWIHRGQWEHAHKPTVRDRASYLPQDFASLAGNRLHFVEGEKPQPSIDGIDWFVSKGHTPYQLLPVFSAEKDGLMFVGDIVPTIAHLRLGWVMGYDLFPLTTIAEREQIYDRCIRDGMSIAFAHDPAHGGVSLGGTVERPIVSNTLDL